MDEQVADSTSQRNKRRIIWTAWGLTFILVLAAGAWLVGAVREAREAARQTQCRGHFAQVQMALFNYHDTYGSFPPAYVADAEGRPMHSWRVLILPFLEQQSLYEQYDFSEPWDGPHNSRLGRRPAPRTFCCPSGPNYERTPLTDYVVIVGPETAFPGAGVTTLDDITDGPENTITLVEIAGSDIHWMEPRDLDVQTMSFVVNDPDGISSPHPKGPAVVFADSITSYRLDASVRPETLQALTTIQGGESVTKDQLTQQEARRFQE